LGNVIIHAAMQPNLPNHLHTGAKDGRGCVEVTPVLRNKQPRALRKKREEFHTKHDDQMIIQFVQFDP
jgi:hypothetical protein